MRLRDVRAHQTIGDMCRHDEMFAGCVMGTRRLSVARQQTDSRRRFVWLRRIERVARLDSRARADHLGCERLGNADCLATSDAKRSLTQM